MNKQRKHNEETYLEIEKEIRKFRVQTLYKETNPHLYIPIVLDDGVIIYIGVHEQTKMLSFELEYFGSIIFITYDSEVKLGVKRMINFFKDYIKLTKRYSSREQKLLKQNKCDESDLKVLTKGHLELKLKLLTSKLDAYQEMLGDVNEE